MTCVCVCLCSQAQHMVAAGQKANKQKANRQKANKQKAHKAKGQQVKVVGNPHDTSPLTIHVAVHVLLVLV